MAEIKAFTNSMSMPQGEVCQDAIDTLKDLMEQAQRGEIVGLAYAAVRPNLNASFGCDGWERVTLIGAVSLLQARMVGGLIDD